MRAAALPSQNSQTSYPGSEPSDASRNLSMRSTVGIGFFRKLSSYMGRQESGDAPPVAANSVELPKGISSPFDSAMATAAPPAAPKQNGTSFRSVELAAGLPSPFASPATTVSTNGKRSLGDPTTGTSLHPCCRRRTSRAPWLPPCRYSMESSAV